MPLASARAQPGTVAQRSLTHLAAGILEILPLCREERRAVQYIHLHSLRFALFPEERT